MNNDKFDVKLNYKSSNEEKTKFLDLMKSLFQVEPTEFSNLFKIKTEKFQKFISTFKDHKVIDWESISSNQNLPWSITVLDTIKNSLNWRLIQINPKTSDLFINFENIEKFKDYLDWYIISCDTRLKWTTELFVKYKSRIQSAKDWVWRLEDIKYLDLTEGMNRNPSLTKEIIDKDLDFWNWKTLSQHKAITEYDIFSFKIFKRLDLNRLSENTGLNIEHLRELKLIYDTSTFTYYSEFSDKKYGGTFEYKEISKNWYFNWSKAFSNANIEYFDDFEIEFADVLKIDALDGGAKGFINDKIYKLEELRLDNKFKEWLTQTLQDENIKKLPKDSWEDSNNIGVYYLDNYGISSSRFSIKIYKDKHLQVGLNYPFIKNIDIKGVSWVCGNSNMKLKLINEIENYIYNTEGYCLKNTVIKHYYQVPIDFFQYYKEFESAVNNIDLKENVIDAKIINHTIKLKKIYKDIYEAFIRDESFIKNFCVYKISTVGSLGSRRSDTYYDYTEYRLYNNGIAVTDEYIKNTLPKEIFNSEREYNDSLPSARNKETVRISLSKEETILFQKNYSLKKHSEYLFNRFKND